MTSLYDVLEIPRSATESEIKKAYRTLSLRYHPDRPGGDSEKFKIISEAYEVLSDPQKKAQYDRFGDSGGQTMGGFEMNHEDVHNINEIFTHILGGHGPGIRIQRMNGGGGGVFQEFFHGFGGVPPGMNHFFQPFISPPSVNIPVSISLQQAYTGCVLPLSFEKTIIQQDKRMSQKQDIRVNIPEGVHENETIVLDNQGHEINGVAGDVRVTVHIENSTEYIRQGMNLLYMKNISLKEALCGFSFDIPLITGNYLTIKNINTVKVIKPGFQQTIHGYGMKRDGQCGNLLIDFQIVFPESLTSAQKEVLMETL